MSQVRLKRKDHERRKQKEREGLPPVRVRTDGVIEPENRPMRRPIRRPMPRREWDRLTLQEKVEVIARHLGLVE